MLAAAYVEAGHFSETTKWHSKAVKLAAPGAKAPMRSRVELYKAGKPYRQTP